MWGYGRYPGEAILAERRRIAGAILVSLALHAAAIGILHGTGTNREPARATRILYMRLAGPDSPHAGGEEARTVVPDSGPPVNPVRQAAGSGNGAAPASPRAAPASPRAANPASGTRPSPPGTPVRRESPPVRQGFPDPEAPAQAPPGRGDRPSCAGRALPAGAFPTGRGDRPVATPRDRPAGKPPGRCGGGIPKRADRRRRSGRTGRTGLPGHGIRRRGSGFRTIRPGRNRRSIPAGTGDGSVRQGPCRHRHGAPGRTGSSRSRDGPARTGSPHPGGHRPGDLGNAGLSSAREEARPSREPCGSASSWTPGAD
jgi:hypothetical protein